MFLPGEEDRNLMQPRMAVSLSSGLYINHRRAVDHQPVAMQLLLLRRLHWES
jgi:hypothetical protein